MAVSEPVLFIEYPPCSTCKKAKRWLDDHGIAYTDRHIVEDNPRAEEIAGLAGALRPAASPLLQHERHEVSRAWREGSARCRHVGRRRPSAPRDGRHARKASPSSSREISCSWGSSLRNGRRRCYNVLTPCSRPDAARERAPIRSPAVRYIAASSSSACCTW